MSLMKCLSFFLIQELSILSLLLQVSEIRFLYLNPLNTVTITLNVKKQKFHTIQ